VSREQPTEAELRGFNLPVRHRLWRDYLLPRLVVPMFWLSWLAILPAWIIGWPARRRRRRAPVLVAIEAGLIGWTQVFFEEFLASAIEALGDSRVVQQFVDRDLRYLPQFRANQRQDNPTHLVLDVRTPGQTWAKTIIETLAVAWHACLSGRTPIVIMPDALGRRLRWKAASLTAFTGVVFTVSPTKPLRPIFPHARIVGPFPMPVSRARIAWLEDYSRTVESSGDSVLFIGHVYPPRSDLLTALGERLADKGIVLTVNGGKWSVSNEDYWRALAGADVVITTCMQGPDRPFIDWIWMQHMVFRFNECLAAGAALVAARVDGVARYFEPGEDFLEFVSLDEAVSAVESLVRDPDLRRRIAASGHAKSVGLADSHSFWAIADAALPFHSVASRH